MMDPISYSRRQRSEEDVLIKTEHVSRLTEVPLQRYTVW